MKKLLLAVLFATSATTALAETDVEQKRRVNRETFERQCDMGVSLGLYALARLEMIEVDSLLEKKRVIAPLCKSISDEEISTLFEMDEASMRSSFAGGQIAAEVMEIDEQRRNGKFSKALIYLIQDRGNCDCEKQEEDLESYERLVKNRAPRPSAADPQSKAREHAARSREYAFVDACESGKEIGHAVIKSGSRPTDEDLKRFSQECADIYAQPEVRKTLDPMGSVKDLHDQGCKMGAETVYSAKGVRTNAEQAMNQMFRCKSISYSSRMIAEETAARTETRRSRTQAAEEAMWQKLREEG